MKAAAVFLAGLVIGECGPAEKKKNSFSLLHPTPANLMREMETDRPDTTESAYSVDAGRFQMEATLFGFSKDGDAESFVFAESNFKLGLTNSSDIQLAVPFFEKQRGDGEHDSGIGDLSIRWKQNLWGNDGGRTALAVMPFVTVPTASHDFGASEAEGGLIVPFAMDLTERIGLGLMAELDLVHDDESGSHELEFVSSIVLGIDWSGRWGSFFEFVSIAPESGSDWEGYANASITFAVNENWMLDAGASLGVNDAAEDFGFFTGMSFRF